MKKLFKNKAGFVMALLLIVSMLSLTSSRATYAVETDPNTPDTSVTAPIDTGLNVGSDATDTPSDESGTLGPDEGILDVDNHTPPPPTVTVTIIKYINGEKATPENANSASFPFTAEWRTDTTDETGDFNLDASNSYEAVTSPLPSQSDYGLTENIPMTCDGDNAFKLDGYMIGGSESEALAGPLLEKPVAHRLTIIHDRVLLVMNSSCEVTPPPSQVTVTIIKYIDGVKATVENASSTTFNMTATWQANNLNGGATTSAPFTLSPVGWNSPNAYEAVTSMMDQGAYYQSVENLSSTCGEEGNDYALDGYHLGNSEGEALENATTSDPTFSNITNDKFILVMNHTCTTSIPPVCTPNDPEMIFSDPTTQVDGHDAVAVTPHPAWTTISGATWISSEALDENGSSPTGTEVYTKTFNISETPMDSTLDIAADNYYTVKVNGTTLDTGTSGTDLDNFSSADSWTIPASMLVSGSNSIEITVTNPDGYPDPNPSGLLYKLIVNSETCPSDPGPGDDTPPPPSGGGGGSSGIGILSGGGGSLGPSGRVLGAETGPAEDTSTPSICEPYLRDYLRFGRKNDPGQVTKLQMFLNTFQNAGLKLNGTFDGSTLAAVKKFQITQEPPVRTPWSLAHAPITNAEWPTGYVYKTTKHTINSLMCPATVFPTPILP